MDAPPTRVTYASAPADGGKDSSPGVTSPPSAALSGGASESLAKKADACFVDPSCSAAEASRLFLQADDRGEKVDCLRLYEGIGVARDWPRARSCFARTVGHCQGNSADLPLATYASMLIGAQGGPRNLALARKALDGCFEDITVLSLRERMKAEPLGARYDFCRDDGGTTLTTNECQRVAGEKEEFAGRTLAKKQWAGLPERARPLYRAAATAWTRFAIADAWLIHDTERDGSIRMAAVLASQQIREAERRQRLATLLAYRPKSEVNDSVRESARVDLEAARAGLVKAFSDDEQRWLVKAALDAWDAYHDAEVALYVTAFGDTFGAAVVREDVERMLANFRTPMLRAEARGLPDRRVTP